MAIVVRALRGPLAPAAAVLDAGRRGRVERAVAEARRTRVRAFVAQVGALRNVVAHVPNPREYKLCETNGS